MSMTDILHYNIAEGDTTQSKENSDLYLALVKTLGGIVIYILGMVFVLRIAPEKGKTGGSYSGSLFAFMTVSILTLVYIFKVLAS